MSITSGSKGILRRDDENCRGFQVRYCKEKARFTRSFPFSAYPTEEEAFAAAQAFHKLLTETFPPMNRREFAEIRRKQGGSEVVGVYRSQKKAKGKLYPVWIARWSPRKNERAQKCFYALTLGEEEAKRRAIEARQAGIREMELTWPERYEEEVDSQRRMVEAAERFSNGTLDVDLYAYEGRAEYRQHLERERDAELRKAAIESFLSQHGELFCEICQFSFEQTYGILGTGLIEVHHILPLASGTPEHITRIEDLMLVCSNCHFVIHAGDAEANLYKMTSIFRRTNAT